MNHDPNDSRAVRTKPVVCPADGSFCCPEPIGQAGGINLYQYAPNPLSWIDPLGYKVNVYKDTPYHGASDNSVKNRAPINGQTALDNSV